MRYGRISSKARRWISGGVMMRTIIKRDDLSENLWRDGQNNYYQEIGLHMYPYDRFRKQILNKEIKFLTTQFDKIEVNQVEDLGAKSSPFLNMSEDQIKKPISIVNDQSLITNALDGGS